MRVTPEADPLLANTVLQEYKRREYHPTPELVTDAWRLLWWEWGKKAGVRVTVPPCDRTAEDLDQVRQAVRLNREFLPMMIYRPKEITRTHLAKIFPAIGLLTDIKDRDIVNPVDNFGWLEVEALERAPHTGQTSEQFLAWLHQTGRTIMSLDTYIIASQFSKLVRGRYFDQQDGSRDKPVFIGHTLGKEGVVSIESAIDGTMRLDLYGMRQGRECCGRSEGIRRQI